MQEGVDLMQPFGFVEGDCSVLQTVRPLCATLGEGGRFPVHRHFHVTAATVYAFKNEIDVWLTCRGQALSEPRPMQKHSNQAANGLNPALHVTRQVFTAFRTRLAIVRGSHSKTMATTWVSRASE